MKKLCALLLLCLLFCVPVLAEGPYFSAERRGSRNGLAEVGGRVYGLSGNDGPLGVFTPAVERWSPSGGVTRMGVNSLLTSEIDGLAAVGDALMIIRMEKSLFLLLDHSTPYTRRVELWEPETDRSMQLDGSVFAAQGRLWRNAEGQLQQLSADGSEVLAAWPGTAAGYWDSFVLLKDGEKHMLLEIATGSCTDVTALGLPLEHCAYSISYYAHAALENGVLYLLEDTALSATDLADGTRRELLTFPEETYRAFVLDAERIILIGQAHRGEPVQSAVYDRAMLQQTLTFTHMTNPTDVLLSGDHLYMYTPYSGAGSSYMGQPGWSRSSSASVIDLTTGTEIWWELDQ